MHYFVNRYAIPFFPKKEILILRFAIAMQCLALGLITFKWGTSIGSFLFLKLDLSDEFSFGIERFFGVALIFFGFLSSIKWSQIGLYILGAWAFLTAFFAIIMDETFHSEFSLLEESARYLTPIVLALLMTKHTRLANRLITFLSWGLATTFIFHGISALAYNPQFIDYLITASQTLIKFELAESQAKNILIAIGILDIFLGIGLIFFKKPIILKYMAFWGIITCLARIIYSPNMIGIEQAFLRSVHWALPLVLLHSFKHKERIDEKV